MRNSDLIRKETPFSMANHWALAGSCILLTVSGFGFLYQIQEIGMLFGGFNSMKTIHNWLGVVFTISLVMSIFTWLKECLHWDANDIGWMLAGGGYLSKKLKAPPMHKLNTGQKLFYLALLGSGFGIIASGFIIWLWPTDRQLMIWSHLAHNVSFIVIVLFMPIHIYLSTIGNPGTLRIMTKGTVPVWWARKKSPLWIEEVEKGQGH